MKPTRAAEASSEFDYLKLATRHGMECGAYVATLRGKAHDEQSIRRAAVAFVNHLPLNDVALERKIQQQFELAAMMAYHEFGCS